MNVPELQDIPFLHLAMIHLVCLHFHRVNIMDNVKKWEIIMNWDVILKTTSRTQVRLSILVAMTAIIMIGANIAGSPAMILSA
jgi:hypothetical protein